MVETNNLNLKNFELADMDRWLTDNNIPKLNAWYPI